ncbi:YmaF family protein [uncultured Clostridium sp.]|uniref:YmaF family protein n=1 Tax=uncultured Clostridium sp. TaxID=59620 RepID=UPI0025F62E2D|nr:YmaF family protein [uncultured Clostridium sp.]
MGNNNNNYRNESQCHNHEFQTSTNYRRDDEGRRHNHRTSGVTGPAIRCGSSHVHKIKTFADTFGDHIHEICDTTGPAIYLRDGKHIHLVKGKTSNNEGHRHDYYFTTDVEDQSNVPKKDRCCD